MSQPVVIGQAGAGIRTETLANSRIDVREQETGQFVAATHNTVSDLVQALSKLKTSTRDIISILHAVKAAGALHADLIIQ